MNYPADFISSIKERASEMCECERRECHQAQGRCTEKLLEPDGVPRWTPVRSGERITFPPVPSDYIALCSVCAVPRNAPR